MISAETMPNRPVGTLCNYCSLIGQSELHAALPQDQEAPLVVCRRGCIGCWRCSSHQGILSCSHEALPSPIKCLKPNRQEMQHVMLRNALYQLERQNNALLNKKRQLQQRQNRSIAPLNLNSTTLQLHFNEQPEYPSDEVNALEEEMTATKKKIKRLAKSQLLFFFWVEVLLSLVALAGTALQTIYLVLQPRNGIVAPFAIYMLILGILMLYFLKVTLQQIITRFLSSPGKMAVATLLILPFWPLLTFCSVPSISLRRLRKGSSMQKWWFMVPQKFPCGFPINHFMFVLKTLAYWMALVLRRTAFIATFEEVTFIMSFLEASSFVCLNLRYNSHMRMIEKDKYRQ